MVVTANRVQETKREVASNMTVITSEDIQASTAATVADLMVQQGFQVITTHGESNVQIRGYGGFTMNREQENTVLILLNGRRVGLSNLAIAGLANVDRVEIIRGPSAVQYGSSAMGGIINIITKRGKDAQPFTSVEVGVGSDQLKRQKLSFGGAVNGFDFAFGGTHFSRDDMTTAGNQRWYHTAIDKNQAYNVDLGYTFAKNHRVGLNYNFGETRYEGTSGMRDTTNNPRTGLAVNTPNRTYTDYLKRNENTALSYTGATDSKALDWLVNYSFGKNEQVDTNPVTKARSSGLYWDNTVFNAQMNYHTSLFTLSGGVDQFKYETSQYNRPDKTAMKDTGAYLTGKLRLMDERLVFSLGLRHDKYENSGNLINSKKDSHTGGSVGVSYLPVQWLKLRASYAEGFKMPSPRQTGGETPYYNASPNLSPETSKTYEVGADVNWRHMNASLTYFHSDWKDKIVGLTAANATLSGCAPTGPLAYTYCNLKRATIAGIEGAFSYDLGKAFQQNYSVSPYVNFTYLGTRHNGDASQRFVYNGRQKSTLERTPEWMASYGVNYVHPGLKFKSRINASYYGDVYVNDSTQSPARYISRPGNTIVSLSLEKELVDLGVNASAGKLTLRTEINNLFDATNEVYWNYPSAGRSFYVGLRYDIR